MILERKKRGGEREMYSDVSEREMLFGVSLEAPSTSKRVADFPVNEAATLREKAERVKVLN